jgi:hypothetical protein
MVLSWVKADGCNRKRETGRRRGMRCQWLQAVAGQKTSGNAWPPTPGPDETQGEYLINTYSGTTYYNLSRVVSIQLLEPEWAQGKKGIRIVLD